MKTIKLQIRVVFVALALFGLPHAGVCDGFDQEDVFVGLDIQPFMSLILTDTDLHLVITSAMVAPPVTNVRVTDKTGVLVYTNVPVYLRVPVSIELVHEVLSEYQTVTAEIEVETGSGHHEPSYEDPYWMLLLDPGAYTSSSSPPKPNVTVAASKAWSVEDRAGTYTGELVIDLIPAD